jgi:hypothetical protein
MRTIKIRWRRDDIDPPDDERCPLHEDEDCDCLDEDYEDDDAYDRSTDR